MIVSPYDRIPPRDARTKLVHVVVDTPKGSRNKFKYDAEHQCFRISRILPAGAVFPYDFGAVPGTCAEDGDPLDVLVVLEEPTFAGCLLTVRLVGVLTSEQAEGRRKIRNDRLVGVPQTPTNKPDMVRLEQLGKSRLHEIEHFFASYNEAQGRAFRILGRRGPQAAEKLLEAAVKRAAKPGEE